MNDRTAELEAAVHAQDELIASAQGLLTRYLVKKSNAPRLSTTCLCYSTDRGHARRSDLFARRWGSRHVVATAG